MERKRNVRQRQKTIPWLNEDVSIPHGTFIRSREYFIRKQQISQGSSERKRKMTKKTPLTHPPTIGGQPERKKKKDGKKRNPWCDNCNAEYQGDCPQFGPHCYQ